MPIYEYSCRHCQTRFERLQFSPRESVSCPNCESREVQRQLSVFSSRGSRAAKEGSNGGCGCTPSTCGCH